MRGRPARPSKGQERSGRQVVPTTALALGLALIGAVGVAHGSMTSRAPFDSLPGLHGAMVVGYLAFLLALLAGIRYRETLTLVLPVMAIQLAMGVIQGASWSALVGLEALSFGAVGLGLSLLAGAPESAPAKVRALRPVQPLPQLGARLAQPNASQLSLDGG